MRDDFDDVAGELEDFEDDVAGDMDPDDDEIGARRRRRRARRRKVRIRVLPLPFDTATLAAAGNATLTGTADKPSKPERICLVTSAGIVTVNGIRCQGENQLAGSGEIPVELFGATAETEDLPWDFSPIGTGGTLEVDITGSAAATINGAAKVKVKR